MFFLFLILIPFLLHLRNFTILFGEKVASDCLPIFKRVVCKSEKCNNQKKAENCIMLASIEFDKIEKFLVLGAENLTIQHNDSGRVLTNNDWRTNC